MWKPNSDNAYFEQFRKVTAFAVLFFAGFRDILTGVMSQVVKQLYIKNHFERVPLIYRGKNVLSWKRLYSETYCTEILKLSDNFRLDDHPHGAHIRRGKGLEGGKGPKRRLRLLMQWERK